jgi:hypothetical protein
VPFVKVTQKVLVAEHNFENLVGQDSLTRFDKRGKGRQQGKKQPSRANAGAAKTGNRPPQKTNQNKNPNNTNQRKPAPQQKNAGEQKKPDAQPKPERRNQNRGPRDRQRGNDNKKQPPTNDQKDNQK